MEPIRGLIEIDDPFYRYQMEILKVQKEKTKTNILNLGNIASNLNIEVEMIVQYIKNRLSTPIKKGEDSKYIIASSIDIDDLKSALYEFIEYFVLCPKCRLPETDINSGKAEHNCRACGTVSKIIKNKHTTKIIDKF